MQVVIRNPKSALADRYRFAVEEFLTYTGSEVQLKHVGADSIALSTGIGDFPVRVIQRSLIVSIDGHSTAATSSRTLVRTVQGSKGQQYTVTVTSSRASCTCAGFQFRGACKHVASVE